MKQLKSLILILFLLNSIILISQNSFGISVGSNLNFINYKHSKESEDIQVPKGVGIELSIFYEKAISDKFAIIGSTGFSSNKIIMSYYDGIESNKTKIKYNQFDLNGFVKYKKNGISQNGFYLKSGISLSPILNIKEIVSNVDLSNDFKKIKYSFNLGFGVDTKYISPELMFSYSNKIFSKFGSIRSNVFEISLLININLSKIIGK